MTEESHRPSKHHIDYFDIFDHFALLIIVMYVSDLDSNRAKAKITLIKRVFTASAFSVKVKEKLLLFATSGNILKDSLSWAVFYKTYFSNFDCARTIN